MEDTSMNETLDRQTFINAMQQMFRRLDAQDELIARLLEGRETAGSGIGPTLDGERLYDTEDLCLMLHVSKRTIQRYRLLGHYPALPSARCAPLRPTAQESLLQGVGHQPFPPPSGTRHIRE